MNRTEILNAQQRAEILAALDEQQRIQERNPIESAYSGKKGKCCCGCSGKHYHMKNMGDYREGGTPNDRKQIARILSIVERYGMTWNSDKCVSTTVGDRVYVLYLKEAK